MGTDDAPLSCIPIGLGSQKVSQVIQEQWRGQRTLFGLEQLLERLKLQVCMLEITKFVMGGKPEE